MRQYFVRTNDVTLFCRDYEGGEPTIVLLPGLTVSGAFFDPLIRSGLSPRFRCIALDLRGRGRSDAPPGGRGSEAPAANYTQCDHAADVLMALDTLGLRKPVLLGHSFGGMLALYLAACAPAVFPRVVLLDAAAALGRPQVRTQLQPIFDRLDLAKGSWEEYIASVRRLPYFDGWWDPGIEAYFRDDVWTDAEGRVRPRARPDAIRAAVEGLLTVDWEAVARRVPQPALLVNAGGPFGAPSDPPFLSGPDAAATAQALPRGRLVTVGGNHLTMAFGEHAREVCGVVAPFIAGDDRVACACRNGDEQLERPRELVAAGRADL